MMGGVLASDDPRARIAAIQRARLLEGALEAIAEYGYEGMTVARVTAHVGVSRRTFYELFENREACFEALIDEAVATVERELADANLAALPWRERMRGGLWTILCFLDREPVLARACVVQAMCAGPRILERRHQLLARLAGALDEGRAEGARASASTPLTAECLVGGIFGIVHASLLRSEREPLVELFGELIGIALLPYLGPAIARREQARAVPAPTGASARRAPSVSDGMGVGFLRDVPMRMTYRTARVLESIAERPGVSNREVGERAEISDQGQISKLMARLERLGLTLNMGVGHPAGGANAWRLTPLGERLAERLRVAGDHGATGEHVVTPHSAPLPRPRARRY